jgi:hypothetical protein
LSSSASIELSIAAVTGGELVEESAAGLGEVPKEGEATGDEALDVELPLAGWTEGLGPGAAGAPDGVFSS